MEDESSKRRYTTAELGTLRGRGESKTDLARVRAKSEDELSRDIAADPDFRDVPEDWPMAAEAGRAGPG